jgi:curved DNA-binding protein CbpA
MVMENIKQVYLKIITASKILGVGIDSSIDEIRQAFRMKMKETHPDTGTDNEELCKKITSAYEDLKMYIEYLPAISEEIKDMNINEEIPIVTKPVRRFLYYVGSKRAPKHWDGVPIWFDFFKDFDTGEEEKFCSSDSWEEMSEAGYPCYSGNPDEYENLYYIIWKKFNNHDAISIRRIGTPFESIRQEYLSQLGTEKQREDVVNELLKKYSESEKTRKY